MEKLTSAKITSLNERGERLYLHPAEVSGYFRKHRTRVQIILMLFFLILPWTQLNGHQTLLLDIVNREFYFFGFFMRAHNAPLIIFLILGGALSLAWVTSIWGRIWCGWACPQTVFIDGLFRRIEYWIEGNYLARRKMQIEPLSFKIFIQKSLKWLSFLILSSFIAHSFLSYFVGSHQFISMIESGPNANMSLFIVAQFFTALFLFDFGWFREQFCTVMCPYGRIQGLLLQKNSLVVAYDEKRKDCISCNRCVVACPIGIDIRNGLQMECIACTACIDACDEIMDKVKKPRGLIKYDTVDQKPFKLTTPRSMFLLSGILVCVLGLSFNLIGFSHSEAFLLRANESPFQKNQTASGEVFITNHFKMHLTNQSFENHTYYVRVVSPENVQLISAFSEITLAPKAFKEWHLFLQIPASQFQPKLQVKVELADATLSSTQKPEFRREFTVELLGPYQ